MAIEKNFLSNPDAMIYVAVHYMQMWLDLQKECDKIKLDQMAKGLSEWIKNKKAFDGPSSDMRTAPILLFISVMECGRFGGGVGV